MFIPTAVFFSFFFSQTKVTAVCSWVLLCVSVCGQLWFSLPGWAMAVCEELNFQVKQVLSVSLFGWQSLWVWSSSGGWQVCREYLQLMQSSSEVLRSWPHRSHGSLALMVPSLAEHHILRNRQVGVLVHRLPWAGFAV